MKRRKIGKKNPPLVGLEPTTFELEVQHANPLRHRGWDDKLGGKQGLYLKGPLCLCKKKLSGSHYVTIGSHEAIHKWLTLHGALSNLYLPEVLSSFVIIQNSFLLVHIA